MDPLNEIPSVSINGIGIPNIIIKDQTVNPIGVRGISLTNIRPATVRQLADNRTWLQEPVSTAIPQAPPVTINAGTPIVNMPGCVKVHKENSKNPASRNKQLVNDDPKQNVVLCDGGMPYFEPPNYDARELSWQTIYQEQEEAEGVDTGEPPAPEIDTPEPPPTDRPTDKEIECPPPNARRIGDLNQAGTERVKEYKLNPEKTICVTIWEDIPVVDRYLPSPAVVTTTASIAAVATTSALLAKPLADLLLRVVKPAVKKVLTKVQTMLGKSPHRSNLSEQRTNRYREKKGMNPINFGKKKKPLKDQKT